MSISDRARERISRPHDARVTRSREALKLALLTLIESKPLDEITIKEITAEAKVSYPVFFRQFGSKEELLADLATEQVHSLLNQSQMALDPDSPEALDQLCIYVEKNRKLWSTLLTAGAHMKMRSEFSKIAKSVGDQRDRANPTLPTELITELVTNSIFDILSWWLRQDASYPRSNVVKLLDAYIVKVFMKPIDLTLD